MSLLFIKLIKLDITTGVAGGGGGKWGMPAPPWSEGFKKGKGLVLANTLNLP